MPPLAGVFALPYKASRNADIHNGIPDIGMSYNSTRSPVLPAADEGGKPSKDKKRRELAGKLGKELADQRRDDSLSRYADSLAAHQQAAHQLAIAPHNHPAYTLALYPISLERAATLQQLNLHEDYALECAHVAWEEERAKVEEEWRKGRERIRDRMLEGIEDRRKRAREDKDGEGAIAEAGLDSQSRPHATRKLRNKVPQAQSGRSPTPPPASNSAQPTQSTTSLTNAYSLALDTLPSPFPLALPLKEPPQRRGGKQAAPAQQAQTNGLGNTRTGHVENGLIPIVGTGAAMGLGKSTVGLCSARELDIEADLLELRRGARRKRAVVASMARA